MKSRFRDYPKTQNELYICFHNWMSTDKILRFGQYMYNNFVHDGEPWPELFYMEESRKAYYFISKYLQDNGS
jgi:predicted NAD-dependent protein-ADP-ribosyltransferase YbiA (DUF1768 family)